MLARDGDDVGQPAAAKQFPLGIRDAALLPEGERRQQGACARSCQLAAAPPASARAAPGHGIKGDDPAQVAGGGDPLAEQQAPPIHPRLVGQAMGRLERDHQRDATAGGNGGNA
jgi:hypothetical protein